MFRSNLTFISLVAALVSIASTASLGNVAENDIASMCPEIFSYVDRSKTGEWTGNLSVRYSEELVGLWIRLVFDTKVSDIDVDVDGFKTATLEDEKNEVLVKNRDKKLKPGETMVLKMTVKYRGTKAPYLVQYRLNARRICPEQKISSEEFFSGDIKSKDFLQSLLTKSKRISNVQTKCGLRPSSNNQIDPWHASLFVKYEGNEQFVCEGTLIDQYHVLTAAHCVTSSQNGKAIPKGTLSLYLGTRGSTNSDVRSNVSKLFIHPEYETSTIFNDLAILKLGQAINIGDTLMPVCWENENDSDSEGFLASENENSLLRREKAIRISRKECIKRTPEFRDILTDETYCVSYSKDNGKCTGNSGASYVSNKGDMTILQGVVALSVNLQNKECNENSVAIVTDVSRYSRWIQRCLNAVA